MRPFILALLVSLPAAAQYCDLDLRYENGQVKWRDIPGAVNYTILETYGGVRPNVYSSTRNNFIPTRRTSGAVTARYIVTAEIEPGVRIMATGADACTASLQVTLQPDPEFRKLTRKVVLPVVGSTPGAFGGRFKTSLELRGLGIDKGRIVFHPAGRVASDDDPSIPYSFLTSPVLKFDDIVAAIGQSGIGSIDIVPDADAADRVPDATVRIYNETSLGTFGSFTRPVRPYDYLQPAGFRVRMPEDPRFRLNMGIRTLQPTTMQALFYRADGRLDGMKTFSFPAGWMEMKTPADFLGREMGPGESVILSFGGAAIPFYTLTENATNDPTLIIPGEMELSANLGMFVD